MDYVMTVLLVYDSVYGNTEKLARAIAGAIQPSDHIKVLRAKDASPAEPGSIDLLIVGSPTQGGRPTPAILEFLNAIPANALKNTGVAAFDTRLAGLFVKIFGYAAGRIAASLVAKGGHLVAQPEGFIVKGKEGPLENGELERAAVWAKGLLQGMK